MNSTIVLAEHTATGILIDGKDEFTYELMLVLI